MATFYHFSRVSANRKTGPIPVTTTSADTCPPDCALRGHGCYAEGGPIGWHWQRVSSGARGISLDMLCRHIRTIPGQMLWRHNQAGDLPGPGDHINATELARLVKANRGRRGFTYTHKSIGKRRNRAAIRAANAAGFTVNLSADNAAHADTLADSGIPTVVVIPLDAGKVTQTPRGRKIVQCPAENTSRVTCANCGLCYLSRRDYLIGFKAKGRKRLEVDKIARGTP
jgi:hypothetical protein